MINSILGGVFGGLVKVFFDLFLGWKADRKAEELVVLRYSSELGKKYAGARKGMAEMSSDDFRKELARHPGIRFTAYGVRGESD